MISNKSISSSNGAIQDEDISTFVVKVYRSDQSFKYFPVLKDTTAQQVVMLAITEFNIGDQSRYKNLSLSLIKQNNYLHDDLLLVLFPCGKIYLEGEGVLIVGGDVCIAYRCARNDFPFF